jgi:iron-sulfur cluster repair protein YtfE (RIC family)
MTTTLIDEATRPKAPKIDGVTPAQRARGRHLAAFHRMHLQQFDEIRGLIERIEAGEPLAQTLAARIPDMAMMRNYRMFGALCGQECQWLTFHHQAEESELFPLLRSKGGEGLRRVVDRLIEEHTVVHALLVELHAGAEAMMASPGAGGYERLRSTFESLERVIRSHFKYEETELEEAMGLYWVD